MALLARILASFQAAAPVSSLTPLDNELNQLTGANGALNGGSSTNRILTKYTHATEPVLELDQLGAGVIQQWKQNGTLKASMANSGQFVSAVATGTAPLSIASMTAVPNLNADMVDGIHGAAFAQLASAKANFSINFFEADPSTGTLATEDRPAFVFPNGTGMKVTRLHIKYSAGSHTAGGSVTFTFSRRGSVTADIGSLSLDNTNNTVNAVFTNDIGDLDFVGLDSLTYRISARSGSITERSVTLAVEGFQLLTG